MELTYYSIGIATSARPKWIKARVSENAPPFHNQESLLLEVILPLRKEVSMTRLKSSSVHCNTTEMRIIIKHVRCTVRGCMRAGKHSIRNNRKLGGVRLP